MPKYVPSNVPGAPAELPAFLKTETAVISRAIEGARDFLFLEKQYKAPAKVGDGMVCLADGTSWNPGSGAGYYGYNNGAWRFLG